MPNVRGREKSGTAARTALVTGANRGIGFEVARQLAARGLRIVLTARDAAELERAASMLASEGVRPRAEVLDVSSEASVAACAGRLRAAGIEVDVLVNNAAIYPEGDVLATPAAVFREAFDTNALGALWTCQAWVPGMLARGYGRIVNVSSEYGSLSDGLEGPAAYGITKAALNALTIRLARDVRGDVKVNAVCPGWVRTRMGGAGATRGVEKGAETIVWLATLPANGPSGGFFRDRKPIPW